MPRKIALYLDTSIPNALFQKPEDRKEETLRFFREVIPNYDVYVSKMVVEEIKATPEERLRSLLLDKIKHLNMLPITSRAEGIAKEYLSFLKIPEADAFHIAIATTEGMDYLVTWNMRHLAKEKTRRIVDNVNFLFRQHRLYIVTPRDFFD